MSRPLADAFIAAALGIVAGIVLSIIVVASTAASRPACLDCTGNVNRLTTASGSLDGRTGAPQVPTAPQAQSGAVIVAPTSPAATVPLVHSRPTATVGSAPEGASSVEVRRLATGAASTPATIHGEASWVRASLGSRYLAARMPRGTVLRITGPLGSVVRVVNDFGPDVDLFPERIVDLSRRDFGVICGDPILLGTCAVAVTVR